MVSSALFLLFIQSRTLARRAVLPMSRVFPLQRTLCPETYCLGESSRLTITFPCCRGWGALFPVPRSRLMAGLKQGLFGVCVCVRARAHTHAHTHIVDCRRTSTDCQGSRVQVEKANGVNTLSQACALGCLDSHVLQPHAEHT